MNHQEALNYDKKPKQYYVLLAFFIHKNFETIIHIKEVSIYCRESYLKSEIIKSKTLI